MNLIRWYRHDNLPTILTKQFSIKEMYLEEKKKRTRCLEVHLRSSWRIKKQKKKTTSPKAAIMCLVNTHAPPAGIKLNLSGGDSVKKAWLKHDGFPSCERIKGKTVAEKSREDISINTPLLWTLWWLYFWRQHTCQMKQLQRRTKRNHSKWFPTSSRENPIPCYLPLH